MDNTNDSVILLGVPIDLGAENLGVDIGPQAFRYQGIVKKLDDVGLQIVDHGDVVVKPREELDIGNPRLHYLNEIVRVNEEVAEKTDQFIRDGHKVIALGGDHSLNLGVISGASVALNGQLGLIYLDAHGDMNTDETTLSGNIHGMHVASLMGYGAKELRSVHGEHTKLAKENLLHIGGSDWDQGELDLIAHEKLQVFSLFDLLSHNLAPLLSMIDDLAARIPNVWVSLDLDVIDRIYAPGAGMPNAKGLSYREIAVIAEYIGQHTNVIGVDIVEYNPLQDEEGKTAELGIELIAKLFGKNYSWYSGYMARNQVSN